MFAARNSEYWNRFNSEHSGGLFRPIADHPVDFFLSLTEYNGDVAECHDFLSAVFVLALKEIRRSFLRYFALPASNSMQSALSISAELGQLLITVGTAIAGCPPYRPGRALISASGSYLR